MTLLKALKDAVADVTAACGLDVVCHAAKKETMIETRSLPSVVCLSLVIPRVKGLKPPLNPGRRAA